MKGSQLGIPSFLLLQHVVGLKSSCADPTINYSWAAKCAPILGMRDPPPSLCGQHNIASAPALLFVGDPEYRYVRQTLFSLTLRNQHDSCWPALSRWDNFGTWPLLSAGIYLLDIPLDRNFGVNESMVNGKLPISGSLNHYCPKACEYFFRDASYFG
jgi:hypothetical protein